MLKKKDNIRVVIVDDSPTVRDIFTAIFEDDPEVMVVGEAQDGAAGIELVQQLKPDIVTMDIFMPGMNGMEAIEKIMGLKPTPIMVMTTAKDASIAFQCLNKGALEVVEKPDFDFIMDEKKRRFLLSKLKSLSKVPVVTHVQGRGKRIEPSKVEDPPKKGIIAICSSTGGPKALSVILGQLPEDFPVPILISQHMYDGFIEGLVDWLKTTTPLTVQIATQNTRIKPGHVYVSPTDQHLSMGVGGMIKLTDDPPIGGHRPSGEILFKSVAEHYGSRAIGLILTGMGADGAQSLGLIKSRGGITIAQNKETCVVFGMPKEAIEMGHVQEVLPLQDMASFLLKYTMPSQKKGQV